MTKAKSCDSVFHGNFQNGITAKAPPKRPLLEGKRSDSDGAPGADEAERNCSKVSSLQTLMCVKHLATGSPRLKQGSVYEVIPDLEEKEAFIAYSLSFIDPTREGTKVSTLNSFDQSSTTSSSATDSSFVYPYRRRSKVLRDPYSRPGLRPTKNDVIAMKRTFWKGPTIAPITPSRKDTARVTQYSSLWKNSTDGSPNMVVAAFTPAGPGVIPKPMTKNLPRLPYLPTPEQSTLEMKTLRPESYQLEATDRLAQLNISQSLVERGREIRNTKSKLFCRRNGQEPHDERGTAGGNYLPVQMKIAAKTEYEREGMNNRSSPEDHYISESETTTDDDCFLIDQEECDDPPIVALSSDETESQCSQTELWVQPDVSSKNDNLSAPKTSTSTTIGTARTTYPVTPRSTGNDIGNSCAPVSRGLKEVRFANEHDLILPLPAVDSECLSVYKSGSVDDSYTYQGRDDTEVVPWPCHDNVGRDNTVRTPSKPSVHWDGDIPVARALNKARTPGVLPKDSSTSRDVASRLFPRSFFDGDIDGPPRLWDFEDQVAINNPMTSGINNVTDPASYTKGHATSHARLLWEQQTSESLAYPNNSGDDINYLDTFGDDIHGHYNHESWELSRRRASILDLE